jgi:hypothetical protein
MNLAYPVTVSQETLTPVAFVGLAFFEVGPEEAPVKTIQNPLSSNLP